MGADGENARSSNCIELDIAYPHFEYPQFKQVAHPSMITTALVLHLWHMLADGGKVAPSPVTAMSSAGSSMLSGRAPSPQPSPVEPGEGRSEGRRVGKACVSTCSSRGAREH